MPHATLTAFGYPDTLIREYTHWAVVLRPKQATLGAMVLIAKADATRFAELPDGAFAELARPVRDIESALHSRLQPDRVNYLKLMMVDPHVHDHVLPRYSATPSYAGIAVPDSGWPGPPAIAEHTPLGQAAFDELLGELRAVWPG